MIFTSAQIACLIALLTIDRFQAAMGGCTSNYNCAASMCKNGGPATCIESLAVGTCLCKDGTVAEQSPGVVPDIIGGGLLKVSSYTTTSTVSTTVATVPFTTRTWDDSITNLISVLQDTQQNSVTGSIDTETGLTDGQSWNTTPSKSITSSIDAAIGLVASAIKKVSDAQAEAQKLQFNNLNETLAKLAKDQVHMALKIADFLQDAKTNPSWGDLIQKFVSAMTRADMDATSAVTNSSVDATTKLFNDLTNTQTAVSALSDALQTLKKSASSEYTPSSSNTGEPIDGESACHLTRCRVRALRIRLTGHSRRLLQSLHPRSGSNAAPPVKGCFLLNYVGEIKTPTNVNEVPLRTTCNSSRDPHTFEKQAILKALEQGARYALGSQVATPGGYPHAFLDLPAVSPVSISASCAGETVLEFPILEPDGSELVNVGKKNKALRVGPDRVLFYIELQTRETGFCGMITHHQETKILDPVSGKRYLPFVDCKIPATA